MVCQLQEMQTMKWHLWSSLKKPRVCYVGMCKLQCDRIYTIKVQKWPFKDNVCKKKFSIKCLCLIFKVWPSISPLGLGILLGLKKWLNNLRTLCKVKIDTFLFILLNLFCFQTWKNGLGYWITECSGWQLLLRQIHKGQVYSWLPSHTC